MCRQGQTEFPRKPGLGTVKNQIAHIVEMPSSTVAQEIGSPARRILEPMDRITEVLFGLIMVLTITCSLSVASTGPGAAREILFGALGCNLAWGIIDAFMYLMARLSERGQDISALRSLRASRNAKEVHAIIADLLPSLIASVLLRAEISMLGERLNRLPEPPERPRLTGKDYLGAAGVFVLVGLSTLPVLVPFVVMGAGRMTVRVSNVIAITMLFVCGHAFGSHIGYRPWQMGISMVVVGMGLVGIAILLGG
jgi:hypothetical protein